MTRGPKRPRTFEQERPRDRTTGDSRNDRGSRPADEKPREVTPWKDSRNPGFRPDRRPAAAPRPQGPRFGPDIAVLFGYHSVREALRANRRKLVRLHGTSAALEKLSGEIAASKVTVVPATNEEISALLPGDAVHQGLLLEARHLEPIDLSELPENGLVLVLDQVTDPHNVGAILRTAAAFGVDAIVTTERHSPALSGILAKSASGGLEHVGMATVVNLARALETLGDMGYLRVGLDSEGPASLEDTPLTRPLALVLGAEGKGLRRLSRENCDVLARLDMPGPIKSLNVSNASAVALTLVRSKLQ